MDRTVLWQYIKWRFPLLFFTLLGMLIFMVIDFLYHKNIEASLYGTELLAFALFIFLVPDLYRYTVRRRSLQLVRDTVGIEDFILPKAGSALEQDYVNIQEQFYEETKKALTEIETKNDMRLDYFTLWVHQIKTPISAMDLLLQRAAEQGNDVEAVTQELFRIRQYVDMALQYVRIENVNSDLVLSECDLNPVLKKLIRKYASIFIKKRIYMNFEPIANRVLTDEKWIGLIAEQILSNAVKYTDKGGVHIYMEGSTNSLVIEDTGPGIRKEDLKRIFEKGYTGFNGRIDEKSTGLGLFLAKTAADKLGHGLLAESAQGEGSRFRIIFSKDRAEVF